jgi:GTP cyclohydrolase II
MAITHSTVLPLKYGHFRIAYHRAADGDCVSISRGELDTGAPIVRIHSSCLFSEAFHALDCDCADQLSSTLKLIAEHGNGVVIYEYAEGRGIGLEQKIRALEVQRLKGIDTVEAFQSMNLAPDMRSYERSIEGLKDLNVIQTIKFASQNPNKLAALKRAGFEVVEMVDPDIVITKYNQSELLVKKHKLGYSITSV